MRRKPSPSSESVFKVCSRFLSFLLAPFGLLRPDKSRIIPAKPTHFSPSPLPPDRLDPASLFEARCRSWPHCRFNLHRSLFLSPTLSPDPKSDGILIFLLAAISWLVLPLLTQILRRTGRFFLSFFSRGLSWPRLRRAKPCPWPAYLLFDLKVRALRLDPSHVKSVMTVPKTPSVPFFMLRPPSLSNRIMALSQRTVCSPDPSMIPAIPLAIDPMVAIIVDHNDCHT